MVAMTFSSLQTDVASYLQRSDLTSYIPTWIDIAERRIARELQPLGFRAFVSSTMTAGSGGAIISQPARLTSMISFVVLADADGTDVGNVRYPVAERTYSFVRAYWPDQSETGRPKFFCYMDQDNFLVAPSPSEDFEFELAYRQRIASLSVSNTTNVLTDDFPELLLHATLLESAPFLKDDPRIAMWLAKYREFLASAQAIEDHPTDADTPTRGGS